MESDRAIFAGLLGVSTVCLIQFVSLERRSEFIDAAVYCFAAATPLLARSALATWLRLEEQGRARVRVRRLADLVGVLAATAGMALLILHLNQGAGAVFVACCVLGVAAQRL